jgi:chromosome segregation ATPase
LFCDEAKISDEGYFA